MPSNSRSYPAHGDVCNPEALREYVVGPVLVYTMPRETCIKRRNSLRAEQGMQSASTSSDSVSFSQMRSHKVLDTAFAGAGTGGILNAWRRAIVTFMSIQMTDCLLCAGGRPGVLPGALTAGLICTMAQLVWNELNVMRVQYVSQSGVTHSDHDVAPTPHKPFSEKIMDGLAVVFPVRKISDEVYLERLLREKEAVERRLEAVRKELQDAERRDNS